MAFDLSAEGRLEKGKAHIIYRTIYIWRSPEDEGEQKASLQTKLNRVKELYKWGHGTKEEYFADYIALQRELRQLKSNEPKPEMLEKFSEFLKNVALAWDKASQEQRNRLGSCLLETVWIKIKKL